MGLKPTLPKCETGPIQDLIGTAYDNVKLVADNIAAINSIAANIAIANIDIVEDIAELTQELANLRIELLTNTEQAEAELNQIVNTYTTNLNNTVDGYNQTVLDSLQDLVDILDRLSDAENAVIQQQGRIDFFETLPTTIANNDTLQSQALEALDVRLTTDINDAITSSSTSITNLRNELLGTIGVESDAIEALQSWIEVNGPTITSSSQAITTLQQTVNNNVSGNSALSTAISGLKSRVDITENSIISSSQATTTLSDRVDNVELDIIGQSSVNNQLTSRVAATEQDIVIINEDITTLTSNLSTTDGRSIGNSNAVNSLSTSVSNINDTLNLHAQDISNLTIDYSDISNVLTANVSATDALVVSTQDIEGSLVNIAQSITDLETTIAANNIPEFDSNYVYTVNDLFTYDNLFYEVIDIQTPPNAIPPNATYYIERPELASIAGTVLAHSSALEELNTTTSNISGTVTALSTYNLYLQTHIGADEAAVQVFAESANGVAAKWEVKTTVNDLFGNVGFWNNGTDVIFGITSDGVNGLTYNTVTDTLSVTGQINIGPNSTGFSHLTDVPNFVTQTLLNTELGIIQNQIDGNITTWFEAGVPTLTNSPADLWTTDAIKDAHIGDLYYDQNTQKAYRFMVSGGTYSWQLIADEAIAEALGKANDAQDTADSKRRVFVVQPIPPYDVGDLWTDGTVIKRADTATIEGDTYSASHWITVSNLITDIKQLDDIDGLLVSDAVLWGGIQNIPPRFNDAAETGLNLTETHMGFYTGGSWKTYLDNVGNFLLNNGGSEHYLTWNGTDLTISGNIILKNQSSISIGQFADAGALATRDDLSFSELTGAKPDINATVGAEWGTNLDLIPTFLNAPSGTGLFANDEKLGFLSAGTWRSFMDNLGNFYLNKDGGSNELIWNGTQLIVRGDVLATSVAASTTITAPTIVGGTIAAGNVNAIGTITATSGNSSAVLGPKALDSKTALMSVVNNGTTMFGVYSDGSAVFTGSIGVGSVGYENLVDKPVDSLLLNNLIDTSVWQNGQTGAVGNFSLVNGANSAEQSRVLGTNPFGNESVLWRTAYVASSTMGGFLFPTINIDNTKSYRISVWVKESAGSGSFRLRIESPVTNIQTLTNYNSWVGALQGVSLPAGEWCLATTTILSKDTSLNSYTGNTTYYRQSTGKKGVSLADFKFQAGTTTLQAGVDISAGNSSTEFLFLAPRIDLLDGNEPSIIDLLGLPNQLTADETTGLNLTADKLGYYDGSVWQSYMDNSGNFYLNGDGNNYLNWDGVTLEIKGDIDATKITSSIAKIGLNAGLTNQGSQSFAIGDYAGETNQGGLSIALGYRSGQNTQGGNSIAIGWDAARYTQGFASVAVGYAAGQTTQNDLSVAIGYTAGSYNQSYENVAIGNAAGSDTQSSWSVAVGSEAGKTTQGASSVAIGRWAGRSNQGTSSVAVGTNAGTNAQSANSVAIGTNAGKTSQGQYCVAIGNQAGETGQTSNNSVLVGHLTGYGNTTDNRTTGSNTVAVGTNACAGGNSSVSIGTAAGWGTKTGSYSISIGDLSSAAASYSTAIGSDAWVGATHNNSTSIGSSAASTAAYQFTLGDSTITNLRCNDTSISSLSDARDKTDVITCPIGLDYLCQLEPVEFTWKYREEHYVKGQAPIKEGTKQIGFLAQNLKEVQDAYNISSLNSYQVYSEEDTQQGIEIIEADQGKLIPVLVKAIQELKAELDELKKKI